jgi:protein phosphatase
MTSGGASNPELVRGREAISMKQRQVNVTNQLRLDIGKLSVPGRVYQENEDHFLADIPNWVDRHTLEAKGRLFVVADGMGGHVAGRTASRLAVERVLQEYYSDPSADILQSLARSVRIANAEIHRQAISNPALQGMGSTVVAAVVRGGQLVVANVGDSRAYLLHGRSIGQITLDHSWVAESMRAGVITREEASQHPYRSVITRSLGSKREVEVDLFQKRIQRGDVLLLCSDGLHGLVGDGEMAEVAAQSRSSQEAVQRLVGMANQRGGPDNITAIVVGMGEAGAAVIDPFSRRALGVMLPIAGGIAALALVVGLILLAKPAGPPVVIPTAEPTAIAQATIQPSPTVTPTSTLVPTSTLTGALAINVPPTPAPGTTLTVTPSPTLYPAPMLVAPLDGEHLHSLPITFTWESTYTLGDEEYFAVEIRQASQDGATPPELLKEPQMIWTPSPPPRPGQYKWDVAIVKAPAGEIIDTLSEKSEPRTFHWEGEATATYTPMPPPTDTPTLIPEPPTPTFTNTPEPTHTPTGAPTTEPPPGEPPPVFIARGGPFTN